MVAGGASVRLPTWSSDCREAIEAYDFAMAAALEARLAAGYRPWPWLEVGGNLSYLFQHDVGRGRRGLTFKDRHGIGPGDPATARPRGCSHRR